MFDSCLVVSDMDGTLLNHHDYSFEAARPLLKQLEKAAIPVIFNTSKTFAELKDWVALLKNRHPFIVENGSAIYIPTGYFSEKFLLDSQPDYSSLEGYQVLLTGIDIQQIRVFIDTFSPAAIDLSSCSLQQAIEITGLTVPEARAAQDRQYSVPLLFDDADQQKAFTHEAKKAGFGILQGGRFLHILGQCDKGHSMQILKKLYEDYYQKKFALVVLGDSPNDLAMLQQADIPVIVQSPSSDLINFSHHSLIKTLTDAPQGWVDGVSAALDKIQIKLVKEK